MITMYFMNRYRIGLFLSTFAQSSKYSIFYSAASASLVTHLSNVQIFVPFTFETRFSVNEADLSNATLIVHASDKSPKSVSYVTFIRIPVIDLIFTASLRRNWFYLLVHCQYSALILTVCNFLSYLNATHLSKCTLLYASEVIDKGVIYQSEFIMRHLVKLV